MCKLFRLEVYIKREGGGKKSRKYANVVYVRPLIKKEEGSPPWLPFYDPPASNISSLILNVFYLLSLNIGTSDLVSSRIGLPGGGSSVSGLAAGASSYQHGASGIDYMSGITTNSTIFIHFS